MLSKSTDRWTDYNMHGEICMTHGIHNRGRNAILFIEAMNVTDKAMIIRRNSLVAFKLDVKFAIAFD